MVKRLAVGVLLINLFVFSLAGLSIYQSRLQYQEQAEITTQNLSRVLEENIDGAINQIDIALLSVQDEVRRQIAGGGIDAKALTVFIAKQQDHQPKILSLRATDAEAVVRYGRGVPSMGGPKNSDREYFIRARDEAQPGLIVTKPVFTRLDKKWAVVLARRLSKPDGSFAGVVYVNVALEHLSKTFSGINVGQHGSVALRDRDLDLVVRYPEPDGFDKVIGSKPSIEFKKLIQAGQSSGTYRSRNPLDNVERTLFHRKISDKPFYITVGVSTDDYLAAWRKETAMTAALMSLFFLTTLLSSMLVYRSWKRQVVTMETVREQKDFLDAIFESEPECVKVIGRNGALLQMNRAGLAMLEVESFQEAKKWGLLHFILPEYRDAFLALSQRVLSGESGTLEFLIEGKKGSRRWLDTHAMPLRNAKGEVTALVGVTRDITNRKRVEDALRESESRFRIMADNAPVLIWMAGVDKLFTFVNKVWLEFTGRSIEQEMGNGWAEGVHPEDFQRCLDSYVTTFDARQEFTMEYRLRRFDGEYRWLVDHGVPRYDDQGTFVGYIGSCVDITERHQMEEQVQQLAFYDTLTKLPNRRLLDDRLSQAVATSARTGQYGALLFLDLDNFKPLNDTHGHWVGDLLLVEVANRLKSCVREMDTVARFGGDEFVVILSELDVNEAESASQARIVAEKIRTILSKPYLLNIKHEGKADTIIEYHCTASIGVALFINHEAQPGNILKRADAAMYQAKEGGRNRIRFYDVDN